MSNPNTSFNQWAAQQPAPAGFAPAGAPAPQGFAPPAGPPMGPPAGLVAQQNVSTPQGYAPQGAPAVVPPAAQPTGGSVFGAGAFGGAAPVSQRKDCADGDYIFEIVSNEQFRSRKGKPMFRINARVVHVYAGTQPVGSEVADVFTLGYPGSDEFKYGAADLLFFSVYALGLRSDHELKAFLHQQAPAAGGGDAAWATFADALQDPHNPLSQHFPPNPLKGKYYRARVSHTPNATNPNQPYMKVSRDVATPA